MSKTKQEKEAILNEYKKYVDESKGIIFANNPGLKVNEIVALRKELAHKNSKFHIIKNTLFRKVIGDKYGQKMLKKFEGTVTAIFTKGEITEAAKIFGEFAKKAQNKPEFRGGIIEDEFIEKDRVDYLTTIPSKEQLITQFVYELAYPIRGFTYALNGNIKNFVYTLNAIKNQK